MRFIGISILFISATTAAFGQPSPELEKKWEAASLPRIRTNLQEQLSHLAVKHPGNTVLVARCYLEKSGNIRNLRIDKTEEIIDVPANDAYKLEGAFLSAVKRSTPFLYMNSPDSNLKHVGLYLKWEPEKNKLSGGMTHPEDSPGV